MDNTVTWFEVATDDPEGAQAFYGGMFDWTFTATDGGDGYRLISFAGAERESGGIADTKGEFPGHAVFYVQVADVEEACAKSEKLGGKVVTKAIDNGTGIDSAYLRDTSGNVFGIFHRKG